MIYCKFDSSYVAKVTGSLATKTAIVYCVHSVGKYWFLLIVVSTIFFPLVFGENKTSRAFVRIYTIIIVSYSGYLLI